MDEKAFAYVRDYLIRHNAERDAHPAARVRSLHIRRVCMWAERLLAQGLVDDPAPLRLAAVFHDVGYAQGRENHGAHSAEILREYAKTHPVEPAVLERAMFLILEHSNKRKWMTNPQAPPDLITLMEADLLDGEGAMGIVIDCMSAAMQGGDTLRDAYDRMLEFEPPRLAENRMVTPLARALWAEKQRIIREFMAAYAYDLGIENET